MTKEEIYSVFDGGDAETALMKLAVSFPGFGRRDLEGVLRTLASSKDEYTRSSFPGTARPPPSGGLTFFNIPAIFSRGREAFRTIFFIMFRTSAWDAEILFQPDFLPFVRGMKDLMTKRLHRRSRLPDFYEEFAEMEDRLVEKIENTPEGASCPG